MRTSITLENIPSNIEMLRYFTILKRNSQTSKKVQSGSSEKEMKGMGFSCCGKTPAKFDIPEAAPKEIE